MKSNIYCVFYANGTNLKKMYVSTNQLKIKNTKISKFKRCIVLMIKALTFFALNYFCPRNCFSQFRAALIHRFVWALSTSFCLPLSHSFHFVSVRESFLIHFAFCFISFCLFMCVKYHVSMEEIMQEWSMKNWLQFQHFTMLMVEAKEKRWTREETNARAL